MAHVASQPYLQPSRGNHGGSLPRVSTMPPTGNVTQLHRPAKSIALSVWRIPLADGRDPHQNATKQNSTKIRPPWEPEMSINMAMVDRQSCYECVQKHRMGVASECPDRTAEICVQTWEIRKSKNPTKTSDHETRPCSGQIASLGTFDPPYIDTCSDGRASKSVCYSPR